MDRDNNYDDEVIADSEGEDDGMALQSVYVPVQRPPPIQSSVIAPETPSVAHITEGISTISSVSRYPPTSVISSSNPSPKPLVLPSLPESITSLKTPKTASPLVSDPIVSSTNTTSTDTPPVRKKKLMPRPKIRKPQGEESATSSISASTSISAPPAGQAVRSPRGDEVSVVVPLPPPRKRVSSGSKEVVPEVISIISSDVEELPAQPVVKKRKVPTPPESQPEAGPSKPTKKRLQVMSDDDEDDPILLLSPKRTPAPPPPEPAPVYDDERFSDFDPSEAPKKPKKPKVNRSKAATATDETKPPKKKRKSKAKVQDESGLEVAAIKSREFIDDSDEDFSNGPASKVVQPPTLAPPPVSVSAPSTSESLVPKPPATKSKKRKSVEDMPKELEAASLDGTTAGVSPEGSPLHTQRGSLRVAILKSIVEAPATFTTSIATDTVDVDADKPKPKKKRKVEDGKKKEKKAKGAKPVDEATVANPVDGPKKDLLEVVIPPLDRSEVRGKSPRKDPAGEPGEEPKEDEEDAMPQPIMPPVVDVPRFQKPKVSPVRSKSTPGPASTTKPSAAAVRRDSTPASTLSNRLHTPGSIPYWRRPNKPLTELLNQSTPGSVSRPSGLHKSIRIAPLHMNRKPPPPPLPPMPKKKTAKKGDGSGSDEDDDETPKMRLKRLAAEFEGLEGMDSKKANDRRKEISSEMAVLMG